MMPLILAVVMQAAGGSGPAPLAIRSIGRGAISRVDSPRQAVARTPEEWAALWGLHAPDRPLPAVDFSKEMVVAIFLGSRPSAGYAVEVTAVKAINDGAIVVQFYETQPPRDRVTAQVITDPYDIVAVPSRAGNVVFEKVER